VFRGTGSQLPRFARLGRSSAAGLQINHLRTRGLCSCACFGRRCALGRGSLPVCKRPPASEAEPETAEEAVITSDFAFPGADNHRQGPPCYDTRFLPHGPYRNSFAYRALVGSAHGTLAGTQRPILLGPLPQHFARFGVAARRVSVVFIADIPGAKPLDQWLSRLRSAHHLSRMNFENRQQVRVYQPKTRRT
jgi:hypothetical protein